MELCVSTNPYQTPEGQLITDDQAVGEIKFFSPAARVNRLRYWAHSMLFTFATLGLYGLAGAVASFMSIYVGIALGIIIFIATVVFSYILMIQRLHDLNKTGWMCLLMLVPFANIYLLVILIFFKGTEGRNNFGLQTPPNKTWHWVMAFSLPVLVFVLGIIAAITLPAYKSYLEKAQGEDSSYSSPESETYSTEYTEDGAIEDTTFSDEAIEDGVSYDAPEEEIIEDDIIDEEAELMEESEPVKDDPTETPQ